MINDSYFQIVTETWFSVTQGGKKSNALTIFEKTYKTLMCHPFIVLGRPGIIKNLKEKGFQTFDWRKDCLDIFSNEDNLTKTQPSKNAKKNLAKALDVFKYYVLSSNIIFELN